MSGVLDEVLAHIGEAGLIFEVVVAIGEGQSTLVDFGDHLIGIVQIGCRVEIEQRAWTDDVHASDGVDESGLIFDSGDAIEFGL